jgi:hypothetical protein
MVLYTEWVAARNASPRWGSPDTPPPKSGTGSGTELLSRIARINRAKPSAMRQSRA